MSSLSTCHLELVVWDGNLVKATTVKEKDVVVTISADKKVSEQCCIATSKGNQIIALIRRNIA